MKKQSGGVLTAAAIYVAVGAVVVFYVVIPAALQMLRNLGRVDLFDPVTWIFAVVVFVVFSVFALPVFVGAWLLYLRLRGDREPNWRAILNTLGAVLLVLFLVAFQCAAEMPDWRA